MLTAVRKSSTRASLVTIRNFPPSCSNLSGLKKCSILSALSILNNTNKDNICFYNTVCMRQLARKFCLTIINFNQLKKVLVATVSCVMYVPRVEPELGEGGSLQPPLCDVE